MEHVEANVQQILIQKGGNLKGNRKKRGDHPIYIIMLEYSASFQFALLYWWVCFVAVIL